MATGLCWQRLNRPAQPPLVALRLPHRADATTIPRVRFRVKIAPVSQLILLNSLRLIQPPAHLKTQSKHFGLVWLALLNQATGPQLANTEHALGPVQDHWTAPLQIVFVPTATTLHAFEVPTRQAAATGIARVDSRTNWLPWCLLLNERPHSCIVRTANGLLALALKRLNDPTNQLPNWLTAPFARYLKPPDQTVGNFLLVLRGFGFDQNMLLPKASDLPT